MCGIYGSLGKETEIVNYPEIQEVLYHRGPDAHGFQRGKNYSIGFTRLSILDLSATGDQPMFDATGRFAIVFNGEIFNYKELQSRFLNNQQLRGSSDTEVLLQLLILKRDKAIALLNGMFAFCFIDTHTGEFILARDRFGIKPLYYTIHSNTLSFASELSALKLLAAAPGTINEQALLEYFGAGYISEANSIYANCNKLLPASYLKGNFYTSNLSNDPVVYWSLDHSVNRCDNYQEAIEEFEEIFDDAVTIRLRSDVPLGIFLSGGIDSGLVAAFAAKKQEVICYNVGFGDTQFDESDIAKETADHIGLVLKRIHLDKIGMDKMKVLGHCYDEPFADSSALPSYEVCKAGSSEAKVFLTGDAGDEAFAGYQRYIKRLKYDKIHSLTGFLQYSRHLPKWVPKNYISTFEKLTASTKLRDAYYDNIPTLILSYGLLKDQYRTPFEDLFNERVQGFEQSSNVTRNQQIFDYQHYLPNDIMVKMDRASMSNSIEVRSPFLDYRLHEFASRLPREWLIDQKTGKKFLRDVSFKYLPSVVCKAKKMGFGIPVNQWTRDSTFLNELTSDAKNSDLFGQYLDENKFEILKKAHKSAKMNAGWVLWNLAILFSWEKANRSEQNQHVALNNY